ncbi:uncharacterized protein LOC117926666 [Vitis riparia]|uniref:uncharacterized protein LOC117926666 n=1 Tax=Vitis riparia TaxID=96939 RepID=UPI00155B065B|nr:uncharacterized protein LOC117926666 [Vitis riparia]
MHRISRFACWLFLICRHGGLLFRQPLTGRNLKTSIGIMIIMKKIRWKDELMKIFLFQCLWLNCYCDGFSRYIEGVPVTKGLEDTFLPHHGQEPLIKGLDYNKKIQYIFCYCGRDDLDHSWNHGSLSGLR